MRRWGPWSPPVRAPTSSAVPGSTLAPSLKASWWGVVAQVGKEFAKCILLVPGFSRGFIKKHAIMFVWVTRSGEMAIVSLLP